MHILVKVYNYTAVVVMDGRWVVDHLVIDCRPARPSTFGCTFRVCLRSARL